MDLEDMLEYLRSIWGFFSVVSILFPFASNLLTAVPTEEYVKAGAFTPAFLPSLGTVCSAFSLLLVVVTFRDRVGERKLRVLGVLAFPVGFFVMLWYMSEYQDFRDTVARGMTYYANTTIPIILYPAFFSLFTVAFTRLALGALDD